MNKKQPPLQESVQHEINLFGISFKEAIDRVQSTYAWFKARNQKLIERQNDQQNSAQVQLISHFAILATLTLTVVGFLISQNSVTLTSNQRSLVLTILIAEVISLIFGSADYIQTILFYRKWALTYNLIGREVDSKFDDGSLQLTSQLGEIEERYLKDARSETNMLITYLMVGSCLFGLMMIVMLFYAYFFNVPLIG